MKLRLQQVTPQSGEVYSYQFLADQPVSWMAGQSIRLEFDGLMGTIERRFTISSAPAESIITITTRLSDSSFKQRLKALQPGQAVIAGAISGNFTWQTNDQPLLIAGGIGITPYRSILIQRSSQKQLLSSELLYINSGSAILFKTELDHLQKTHPEFSVAYISRNQLYDQLSRQQLKLGQKVYVSGPQPMVTAISDYLANIGIEPGYIIKDAFTGYSG